MPDTERDQLGHRVKRYAKVSASLLKAGAATSISRLAGADASARAALLCDALGGLKGPIMKVAQILGTIPDLVPKEFETAFAELQADAPPMGRPFVRRRMAAELGPDWQAKFKAFDLDAAAAASLGQVHRAEALDGTSLACKLQYPEMASTVEADIRQLRLFLGLYEKLDRSVDTLDVQTELAERLREELDYTREARNIALFRAMLGEELGVEIPTVRAELSTSRLLTMSWLEGERLVSFADRASEDERKILSETLFKAWYQPFYRFGILHGDPHLGNYTVRQDLAVNLLDFGCIRVFDPLLIEGVLNLFRALETHDEDLALEAYRAWGFEAPSKALVETLNIWARFIYAPLLEDRAMLIEETNTGVYGRETARRVHAELRKLGGVKVPRAFVFMDRAAVGLGAVFLRLHARCNWRRFFEDAVQNYDTETVSSRQAHVLKKTA